MIIDKKMTASAKKISKSEKLFLQARENDILITNTFYLLRVDNAVYNAAFRGASPDFIELQAGQRAQRCDKNELMRVSDNAVNIQSILDGVNHAALQVLERTAFIGASDKNAMRLYLADCGDIVAIDEEWRAMLEPFTVGNFAAASPVSPLVDEGLFDSDANCGTMILPIKQDIRNADITIVRQDENAKDKKRALIDAAEKEAAAIIEEARAKAEKIIEAARNIAKEEAPQEEATEEAQEPPQKAEKEPQEVEKAEAMPQEAAADFIGANATIKRNAAAHGIELYFEEVPRASVRNKLKANGFRWHTVKRCWYAKDNEKSRDIALSIAR